MTPITEKCSLFKPYFYKGDWRMSTKPETVNVIDMLTFPWQGNNDVLVRNEKDKIKRSILKKQLWAITPSSIQEGGRGIKHIKEHNGLMQFDIDPEGNEALFEKEGILKVKEFITQIPFTLFCGLSASGNGLWGLFRISHPHLHEQHFNAMEIEFSKVGIKIDPAPKSPASLRFVSYDENGFFNEEALIFDKKTTPEIKVAETLKVEKKLSSTQTNTSNNGNDLCKKFNSECTAALMDEILTNFGFNYHSLSGKSYRYTRPGKETQEGLSVDYHEDKRTLYSFSSNVPGLNYWKTEGKTGYSCSPLTALRLYGFGEMPQKGDSSYNEHWINVFSWINERLP